MIPTRHGAAYSTAAMTVACVVAEVTASYRFWHRTLPSRHLLWAKAGEAS